MNTKQFGIAVNGDKIGNTDSLKNFEIDKFKIKLFLGKVYSQKDLENGNEM